MSYAGIDIDNDCTGPDPITTPTLTHYYHLTRLTPSTHYYLEIKVTDSQFDKDGVTKHSFTSQAQFDTTQTPVGHDPLTDEIHQDRER